MVKISQFFEGISIREAQSGPGIKGNRLLPQISHIAFKSGGAPATDYIHTAQQGTALTLGQGNGLLYGPFRTPVDCLLASPLMSCLLACAVPLLQLHFRQAKTVDFLHCPCLQVYHSCPQTSSAWRPCSSERLPSRLPSGLGALLVHKGCPNPPAALQYSKVALKYQSLPHTNSHPQGQGDG